MYIIIHTYMPIKKRHPKPSPPKTFSPPPSPDRQQLLTLFLDLWPSRQLWRLPSLRKAPFYDRLFNPIVTLWYFMFQRLHSDSTLQAALVDAWSGGADRLRRALSQKLRSFATTALSDARQRLPLAFLQEVLGLQAQRLARLDPNANWRTLQLRLLDGSTVRLRPYGDIPKHFPPHGNQSRHPAYWCLMRVVVCFCAYTGTALGYALSDLRSSEQVLAAGFMLSHPGRFLYLGDRNFGVFRIVQAARAAGAQVLVRLTRQRARRLLGRSLRLGSFALAWSPTRHDQQQPGCSSAPIEGRLLVVRVHRPGFRPQTLYLFTTLEDLYPAQELAALYGLRWHIELNLRYLKTQMRLVQLECKSAAMAEKEWVAGLLAYNLVRAAMLCAALKAGLRPLTLSFSAARRHVQRWVAEFAPQPTRLAPAWARLLFLIAKSRLPHRARPRPSEPRAQRHLRQSFPPLFGTRVQARRCLSKYHQKN
jgi:putative transposase